MPLQQNPERGVAVAAAPVAAYPARVPLVRAAAAQAGAALLVLALAALAEALPAAQADAMGLALLQGVVAARLARGLGMDVWWLPMHALFVPGLVWSLRFDLSPGYALGAFCLLASLYWGVSRSRVPLFLSSRATSQALADLLPKERSFRFLDLGCGLGGVLASLARTRPAGCYYGIESAPLPFLISRLRALFGMRPYRTSWGDFHTLDLGRYDVVYAYLSPAAMGDLWYKARREMRSGSLLISNSFAVPDVPPAFTVSTGPHGDASLLLWVM